MIITVRSLLGETRAGSDDDERRREAEILVAHALGRTRAWLYAHADDAVGESDAAAVRALIAKRSAGVPVAYLVGEREFWSLPLSVTPDVLIPRPETELLVDIALRHIPQGKKVYIADLGTGSGAIALAIASERPDARIVATDSSPAALEVAAANGRRHAIGNVRFVLSDWFTELNDEVFDVIVSNPPYIASNDAHLSQGDLRHEPAAALSSGSDGLDAIRTIVAAAPRHLTAGGVALLEHGFDQGAAVRALLAQTGLTDVFTQRDIEGRERVSGARKPSTGT